ncbi:MAG: hypothetical protein ACI8RD_008433, partial [Bacillariaceae sp.]
MRDKIFCNIFNLPYFPIIGSSSLLLEDIKNYISSNVFYFSIVC